MMEKMTYIFISAVFSLVMMGGTPVLAEEGPSSAVQQGMEMVGDQDQPAAQAENKQAVDVGNKICPVSGQEIVDSEDMPSATYEYEGKIYHFCCAGCIEEFKKDPQKYIAKVEEELKTDVK